jgi:hypothetical protein
VAKVADTLQIQQLVGLVNRLNRFSKDEPPVRKGWNLIVEEVLLQTGNYKGFKLLGPDEVPDGHIPGVGEGGSKGDQTRILWIS